MLPLATITPLARDGTFAIYELWFHFDLDPLMYKVKVSEESRFRLFFESGRDLVEVRRFRFTRSQDKPNVFEVQVEGAQQLEDVTYARFVFPLEDPDFPFFVETPDGRFGFLREFMDKFGIHFDAVYDIVDGQPAIVIYAAMPRELRNR